jgi:hypothetical protein
VEDCIESYILSVYFATDNQIKLNSGPLIRKIIDILNDENSVKKVEAFMVSNDVFLGFLTALNKMFRERTTESVNSLYWGSVKKFDKSIVIEKYQDDGSENLKISILGGSNQILYQFRLSLRVFTYEIGPFVLNSYEDYQKLCVYGGYSKFDMRKMVFPSGFLSGFSAKGKAMIYLIFVQIVIALIVGIYAWCKSFKRKTPAQTKFTKLKKKAVNDSLEEEDMEEIEVTKLKGSTDKSSDEEERD